MIEKTKGPATGEEAYRRLMRVSQLRELIHECRASLYKSWLRGEYPYQPPYDIRTDYEYWKKISEEHNRKLRAKQKPVFSPKDGTI